MGSGETLARLVSCESCKLLDYGVGTPYILCTVVYWLLGYRGLGIRIIVSHSTQHVIMCYDPRYVRSPQSLWN